MGFFEFVKESLHDFLYHARLVYIEGLFPEDLLPLLTLQVSFWLLDESDILDVHLTGGPCQEALYYSDMT